MRKDDEKVEGIISDYLDRYFYGQISHEKNIPFFRVREKDKQVRGIDVILGSSTIDEKVKFHDGTINRVLQYPSLELSFIDRSNRLHDGWFISGENTHYALVSIFTNGKEHVTSIDDLSCLQVLFVSKKDILDLLEHDGIDYISESVKIRSSKDVDPDERTRFYYTGGYRLVWSKNLPENPVNLVIPRRKLETLSHSKDMLIYPDSYKKISHV